MEKTEIIKLIAGRIEDEHRKHPTLNWQEISASKIYSQWFEFFDNKIKEAKSVSKTKDGDMEKFESIVVRMPNSVLDEKYYGALWMYEFIQGLSSPPAEKELKDITDEDKIEVAKMFYRNSPQVIPVKERMLKEGGEIVQFFIDDEEIHNVNYSLEISDITAIHKFLTNQGYKI